MTMTDKETLKKISLTQLEIARLLGTSRQAVNAGVHSKDEYLDKNRLLLIHRALVSKQDLRSSMVAQILNECGVQINEDGLSTLWDQYK